MTIWALKSPATGNDYEPNELARRLDFLTNSAKSGTSRFGWSWLDTANLDKLEEKQWVEMSPQEVEFWKMGNFLKDVAPGDWIIHINLPLKGKCIAGQVIEGYSFEENDNSVGDYRHMIKLNVNSIVEFDRNNKRVLPIISNLLKLRGRYWRIYETDYFLKTIENLNSENFDEDDNESTGLFYLKQELQTFLKPLTAAVQKTHPGAKLENLIAEIFRKVPGVLDVKETGRYKGWGTDYGADLLVTYKSGLPIENLATDEKLVIQIKSFINEHWETNAVEQIKTAIEKYQTNSGLIITTAQKTDVLTNAIDKLIDDIKKPVALIAGEDVAKFILTHGSKLLL